jgi:hypothetical protein
MERLAPVKGNIRALGRGAKQINGPPLIVSGGAAAAPPGALRRPQIWPILLERNAHPCCATILKGAHEEECALTELPASFAAGALFDHIVGEREQFVRRIQSERPCGLEVDYKLELG